jgi:hypothetical protein
MLKKLITISLIIAASSQLSLSYGQDFDFRNTRWGMSQEQVVASEINDPVEKNENYIKYETKVLNINVDLQYLFVEDKLIVASYTLDEIYLNSKRYKYTYNIFEKALIDKFGEPKRKITNWMNDTYKNNSSRWGLAIGLGHVEYFATWKTESTVIRCSLTGENHNILSIIRFSSIEYKDLEKYLLQKNEIKIF